MPNGAFSGQLVRDQRKSLTTSQKSSQKASKTGKKRWTNGATWWSMLPSLLLRWLLLVWDLTRRHSQAKWLVVLTSWPQLAQTSRDMMLALLSLDSITIWTSWPSTVNQDIQDYSSGYVTCKRLQWRSPQDACFSREVPCLNTSLVVMCWLATMKSCTLRLQRPQWKSLGKIPREFYGECHPPSSLTWDTTLILALWKRWKSSLISKRLKENIERWVLMINLWKSLELLILLPLLKT